tara:strand:- start:327 stop:878 length:552 start_codon:yes stop_codon:yes gene_type:complete
MKKYIILFLLLSIPFVKSFSQDDEKWMLNTKKSSVEYNAKHLLHKWNGKNNNVKGVVYFDNNEVKIAVAANIADFDSGISNRDSNALRVLNAFKHPQVRFYSDKILISDNTISFDGELDFHGIKIKKKLEASYIITEKTITIEGGFSIVLTDFNIKLPSLMLVKMDDLADISYKLIFDKNSDN